MLAAGPLVDDGEVARAIDAIAIPVDETETQAEDEQERVLAELENNRWKHGRTAAALGISRTTLWRKLKKLERS